jgi:membrane-bound lytic murein transglycosylase B
MRSVGGRKRIDGRTVVAEHLSAFERAPAEVAVKTKGIMAVS